MKLSCRRCRQCRPYFQTRMGRPTTFRYFLLSASSRVHFIREIFDRGSRTGFLVLSSSSGDHFLIFNKYDMFWSMLTSLSSNKLKHVLTSLILSKPVQTCPKLFKFVQTCLNLFKIDQTLSNLFKPVLTCINLFKLV